MIYRSRYLDRMLFSPLGYRHSARAPYAKRTRPRAQTQAYAQPRSEEPVSRHYQDYQPDALQGHQPLPQSSTSTTHQARAGHHTGHLGERAGHLSSRELHLIVGRCEEMIRGGRAQIEDYEAFVICQQELSNRA